ncbi:hypothetical protein BGZ73_000876 [Actinomortierella ambigua]|nr:hypothetical protein BGZ73_000876 [Actinomortierella ambigua]
MPNQTRLSFQQQKPGTRRVVNRKPAAEETKNVEAVEKPAQPDTAALLSSRQSMEDKLKAFLEKKKEAKDDAKRPQRPTTRSTGGVKRKIAQARDESTSLPLATTETLSKSTTAKGKSEPLIHAPSEEHLEKLKSAEDKVEKEEETQQKEVSATRGEEENSDVEASAVHTLRKQTVPEQHLATPPASSPIEPSSEDEENIHIVARKSVKARPLYIAEEAPDASAASKMTTTVPTTRSRSVRSAALQARLSRISATFSTASQGNLDDVQGPSTSTIPTAASSSSASSSALSSSSKLPYDSVSTGSLLLPKSLETLFKIFRGLDHIVRFHQHQGQQCFYHKVQKQVERVASQNFEIRHLAQIKTLYPEAFEFSVAPCLHEGKRIRSYLIELKAETVAVEKDTDCKERGEAVATNTRFIPLENQRRDVFRERLVQHVYKHHKAFLQSTVPPRTDPFPLSWHQKFDLESVPEVNQAQLPELQPRVITSDPNFELHSLGTKASVSQPISLSSPAPQPEGKLGNSSSSSSSTSSLKTSHVPHGPESASTSKPPTVAAEGESTAASGPKQGAAITLGADAREGSTPTEKDDAIPVPKLLSRLEQMKEKIRQKQLEKQLATQGLASKADKTLALQRSRLPAIFDMIKFLRFKVMAVQSLAEKIAYSHKMPLSELEARQHLQLLAQELPEWCQIFAVGGTSGTNSSSGAGDHFKILDTDPAKEKQYRSRLVQLSLSSASR